MLGGSTMKVHQGDSVDEAVKNMPLRALLCQLIMIEFSGTELPKEYVRDFGLHPWGGVILFASNIDHEDQLRALTAHLQHISLENPPHVPIFVAVDQEGGIVSRFSFESMTPLCGNMALGATGVPQNAYESGRICASELLDAGINVDFAPDIDVNNNPANPIIGARSFGESPELVSEMGRFAIRGMREGGIIPAAKHFPGHGDTTMDSHSSLPIVNRSKEELLSIEIAPFMTAIEEQVEMIMTAHIIFPALEPSGTIPATLSKAILTDFLREELHYDGVIITDSMAMKAITSHFGYEEAAVRAFEAGADMVLLCGSTEQQLSSLDVLEESVKAGRLSRARLEKSCARLFALKERIRHIERRGGREATHNLETMRAITRSSITLVKNDGALLPLRRTTERRLIVIMPSLFPLSPLGEAKITPTLHRHIENYGIKPLTLEYNAKTGYYDEKKFASVIGPDDVIVYAAFCNGRLPAAQVAMIDAVMKQNRNIIAVSLNSPYVLLDIPDVPACLNCYNYGDISMEALTAVLFGESKPVGRLPVTLPGLYPRGHSLTYGQ
jgi:beta-N-acetylhexosaminidase